MASDGTVEILKTWFGYMRYEKQKAFTLIELLVVISVIIMLMAILMPALAAARFETWALVCKSNLRQLLIASIGYATENDGFFVPAASDMWDTAGLNRWHGRRDTLDQPFDPLRGPLVEYLADGQVRQCAVKVDFVKGQDWDMNFEQGCGGYGYNMTYIGSRLWQSRADSVQIQGEAYMKTTRITEISSPAKTLMFADSAMARDERTLIEYSFAEPPFTVYDGRPMTGSYMSPSIHFRHGTRANIGWADTHVDSHQMAGLNLNNAYSICSADMNLGWFEPIDNTLFDLE